MIQYLCDRCRAVAKVMFEPVHESCSSTVSIKPDSHDGCILLLPTIVGKKFDLSFGKMHLCARCIGELAQWLEPGVVTR